MIYFVILEKIYIGTIMGLSYFMPPPLRIFVDARVQLNVNKIKSKEAANKNDVRQYK